MSLPGHDPEYDKWVELEDEAWAFVGYLNNLKASRPEPVEDEEKPDA